MTLSICANDNADMGASEPGEMRARKTGKIKDQV
eukprot:CAMPEP_0115386080 /NCGR_PEP_ID=MMETSP0271-20121206/7958_1 /TAXON_ID=71861 /ORGANISM="Scrippsiella trochoidea, Strain CCMP3099" /LENGTH=33 /DNA_ID= /DNA_START= /DNA_END= /DNA_ORIENTATION=